MYVDKDFILICVHISRETLGLVGMWMDCIKFNTECGQAKMGKTGKGKIREEKDVDEENGLRGKGEIRKLAK